MAFLSGQTPRRTSIALTIAALVAACRADQATSGAEIVGVDEDDVVCDPLEDASDALRAAATSATPTPTPLVQWVDPRLGTGGVGFATGSTYPGAQVPHGMARPGPDTSHAGSAPAFTHCSGYAYGDDVIDGFSHFRLHGAGIADYGGMALMPTRGMTPEKTKPRGHGSRFSHDRERASPGYYAVTLDDSGVEVELTASERVAFHRYRFTESQGGRSSDGDVPVVLVDAGHLLADGVSVQDAHVELDPTAREVRGFVHVVGSYSKQFGGMKLYFVARFSRDIASFGTFAGGALAESATLDNGPNAGVYLRFDGATRDVEVQVGLSLVDEPHAAQNLAAETKTFDEARQRAEAAWEARLGRVRIEARSDRDRRVFMSALYHTALMPTLASDVDGSYRGIDGRVHAAEGFRYFTDFSTWDTYRTLHPWVTLVAPDDARDFASSLLAMGKDGGALPRWPIGPGESRGMLGDGAAIVLADTAVKGITGWDEGAAYALAKTQATTALPREAGGREGLEDWTTLGFVAAETERSSASMSLEYAAADAALSAWAASRGAREDAAVFAERSRSWRKLYDPASHFLAPRNRDCSVVFVNPAAIGEPYVEGSAWHYNFMVPHDIDGLVQAMSRPVFLGRLEQLFTRAACTGRSTALPHPYYWPANEPVLFSGWAFAAAGDSRRASRWLRWTTTTHFGEGPTGLPGNDDGGTMSAFYLFAALGFYPIPGTDRYVLGTPLFPRATLELSGGPLSIEAPNASTKTRFVRRVSRNGAELPSPRGLAHRDLAGATLTFDMTDDPR